ncbi:MAG: hypothetical protein WCU00_14190 [Candidatus Latescibacterota bacterium]
MKSILRAVLFCSGIFFIVSCGSDNTTSAVYTDSVTFGTGNVGWNITGETTSFINNPNINGVTIYYRVETEDDMKGSNINLEIEKNSETGFDQVHIVYLTNPSKSGHVVVGSYLHMLGEGTYRANARLLATNQVVATKDYVVTNAQ